MMYPTKASYEKLLINHGYNGNFVKLFTVMRRKSKQITFESSNSKKDNIVNKFM